MNPRCAAVHTWHGLAITFRCRRRSGHLGRHRNVRLRYGVEWWTPDQPDCPPPITAEQLQELIAALENMPALTWADVELCTQLCTVSVTKSMNARREILPLKTERSRRVLRLPALLVEALNRLRDMRNHLRPLRNDTYITADQSGPAGPLKILRALHKILDNAGIERRRVHDLRHTCATLLLADGAPIQHVSDLLGHASIKTTKDVYGHVIPATFAAIAEQSDKIMRQAMRGGVN